MKVYFTPVKVIGESQRVNIHTFLHGLVSSYDGRLDFKSNDKEVRFKFFEDRDIFIVITLTTKDIKNFCEGEDSGTDFTWKLSGDLTNKIAETNILLISKKNFAGAYLNNEGSVRLNTFESKLRWAYRQAIRDQYKKNQRAEKFRIDRLIDSDDILDKVSRLSVIDEINATFTNPQTSARMNGSIFKSAKSMRVTQRVGGFSLKLKKNKKEISDYLEGLVKSGCSGISIKGAVSGNTAGETIGIIDSVNSIHSLEYADYIASLDGLNLSDFLSSDILKIAKKEIFSKPLILNA